MVTSPPESEELLVLRNILATRFSASDLRTLAFDLGIDYEGLAQQSKPDLARELLQFLARRHDVPKLLAYIRNTRPDIVLPDRLATGSAAGGDAQRFSAPVQQPALREVWDHDADVPLACPLLAWGELCLVPTQDSPPFDRNGLLRALRVADGDLVWEEHFASLWVKGLACTPALAVASLSAAAPPRIESVLVALDPAGRRLWRCQPHATQLSAPVIADGLVYATADGQELVALDLDKGKLLSRIALPAPVASPEAPTIHENVAYIPCRAPVLFAVGLDGDVRWHFNGSALANAWLDKPPLLVGGLVLAPSTTGVLVAIDAAVGKWAWRCVLDSSGRPLSPLVADAVSVYAGSQDGVHAVRLEDGKLQWKFPTSAGIEAAPVLSHGVLYAAGRDHRLYALDAATGSLLWQHSLAQSLKTPPLLVEDGDEGPYAILADRTGHLTALAYPVAARVHELSARWHRAAQAWETEGNFVRAASAWEQRARELASAQSAAASGEAWGAAARAHEVAGQSPQAAACRAEEARSLGLPLISVDVEIGDRGLVLSTWSKLKFTVRNAGAGLARDVVIQVIGNQFEGQVTQTREVPALPAGASIDQLLDVRPLEHGQSVPMRVQVGYQDAHGGSRVLVTTVYIPVASQAGEGTARGIFHVLGPRLEAAPYVDVQIRLGAGSDGYTVEVTLDRNEVFPGGSLPSDILSWRSGTDLAADGRRLFELLMRNRSVRDAWVVARSRSQAQSVDCRVRLRIAPDAPLLHTIPWEAMHDGDVMLAAHRGTPFSRYLPTSEPAAREINHRPVRILAVIANPRDLADRYALTPLRVDLERYLLAKALASLDRAALTLSFLSPPITLARLSRALQSDYHIIHFVGHGRFSRAAQQTELLMENAEGDAQPLSECDLCAMLARRSSRPHLMYFSACQGAAHSDSSPFVGLAPRVVQAGVPAVVAMQGDIGFKTAQVVAGTFYGALASHGYVDRALNEARDAVLSQGLRGAELPVLYMRLESGKLW